MAISQRRKIEAAVERVEARSVELLGIIRNAMDKQVFGPWEQRNALAVARQYANAINRLQRIRK